MIAAITALPFAATQAGANQPALQSDAPVNSVVGNLSYNKETVRLKYAYAKLAEDDFETGKFFIMLLFTDRPVTEGVAESQLADKLRSGLLKAVSIRVNSATRRLDNYSVYVDKEQGGFTVYTPRPGDLALSVTMSDPNSIEGTASRRAQPPNANGYSFNVRFKAAVKKNQWTGVFEIFPPINIEPGRAEGSMSYDGKARKLNHVYAQVDTDMFDERERKVNLVFTERPYSPGGPSKEHVPYLEFTLDSKTLLGLNIMLEEGNLSYSNSAFKIDLAFPPGNIVEGRFADKAKVMSKDFECALAFKATFENDADAPVTARTGKPLAARGGEPGAAFLEIIKAAQAGGQYVDAQKEDARLDALAKKSEELGKYRFQARSSMFLMSASLKMKNMRVTGGFTDGNKATLDFVIPDPKSKTEGKVNMHLENGQWKVGRMGLKDENGKLFF